MIPIIFLVGMLAGAAVVVAITFWDQIKKFLKIAFDKIKKIIPAAIAGVAVYVQTQNWREGISAAYKFYSQNEEGLWQETIATRTINVEELPEHIRKKLENTSKPIDISEELELELES